MVTCKPGEAIRAESPPFWLKINPAQMEHYRFIVIIERVKWKILIPDKVWCTSTARSRILQRQKHKIFVVLLFNIAYVLIRPQEERRSR